MHIRQNIHLVTMMSNNWCLYAAEQQYRSGKH